MNFFGVLYIADWLLFILLIFVAVYKFWTWRFNELADLGIPGPKPSVPLGNLSETFKLGILRADIEYIKKYGKIYGSYFGRSPVITIADLDIVRQVLIKDFDNFQDRRTLSMRGILAHGLLDSTGERWRTMRRKLTPAFTSGKLKLMLGMTKKCAETLVETFDEFAKSGEMFEIKGVSDAFTSDNIASTSFGIELNAQKTPDHPFIRYSNELFNISLKNFFIAISFFLPDVAKVMERWKPSTIPEAIEDYFVNLVTEAIQARKENPGARKDLIQIILDAEKDLQKLDDETKAVFEEGLGFSEKDRSGLTQDEVVGNLFLFVLAGQDTSAGTLSFLLYNLALHPEFQQKLVEEIEDIVGEKDVAYDMLNRLTYMDKCLNESMRLYPIATKVDRVCLNDKQYGNLKIPKGVLVGIPVAHFHYDPEVWPDPERYDPSRFDAEEKAKRDPLSFMPFGFGPRMCIGNRFAIMTIKVALVYILRNFRFLTCEKTEVPLTVRKDTITLQAENGIWLKVERR